MEDDSSSRHDDQQATSGSTGADHENGTEDIEGLRLEESANPGSAVEMTSDRASRPATSRPVDDGSDRRQHPSSRNPLQDLASRRAYGTTTYSSPVARASSGKMPSSSSSSAPAAHQSQLRKQAMHPVPKASNLRHPSPSRFSSTSASSSHVARHREVAPLPAEHAVIPRPIVGQPSAFNGNLPPEEPPSWPTSPTNTGSGWTVVETTRGEAGGAPPSQRSLHTAAVLNGSLYVFGGYDGQARVNDFHAFSFAEKRWSPVLPAANSGRSPSPRDRHTAVCHGNSFYVFGGFDGTSRISDFFAFDFSSMTWREVIPLSGDPPTPRHSHAAVVHGDKLYIFGGYDGSYRSDFHEYDFNLSKWSVIPPAGRPPRARYRATCVVHKNTMLLFGGHDGTRHLADTHVFDFETRVWSALVTEGVPPIPRDSHVSVVHGSSMYVFGGSTGSAMSDLHELQLPSDASSAAKWRPINTSGAGQPGPRFCHVGAVYMDAMYVFGGYDGSDRLNDFIRFDFAVDDLNFEVPPSTIISDLRSFVNDETLSDITFIVEDQPVHAHKLMLIRCSYFQAMFMGEMVESHQSTIRLDQVGHSIFLSVLEYLYTDKVHIPLESAMDLFVAADLFCIPRLKTMCEKRMLQSITIENAATIFHAADVHCATALRRKVLKYILHHFEAVSKTAAFEEMARGNVELVFEILKSR